MSYSPNSERKRDVEPKFNGYQLIGDSQFLRFSEQILNRNRRKENGIAYLGLCVSGQKISDLLKRVENNFYPTHRRAVLMIGTNDLLQNTSSRDMIRNLESLILTLVERGVRYLILLTVPPVPRLAKSYDHWSRLKDYNDHIRSLHNGEDVFVVDVYPKFVKSFSPSRRNSRSPRQNSRSLSSSPKSHNSSRTSIFSSIDLNPSEPLSLPNKGALRISVSDEGRSVYVTDDDDRRSKDWSLESRRSVSTPLSLKRIRRSSSSISPPLKRKSTSFVEDDHDDRFCENESFEENDIADKINFDLFEEYFSRSSGRKDLIHLNSNGLHVIRRLIANEIRRV